MVLWSETEPVNFNSAEFLVFYAIVFVGYFCLPHRFRWMLLLVASYWFYAQWNVAYLTLIVYASGCAYSAGLLLSRRDGRFGKLILWIAIVLLLLPLLVFKYASFFVTSVVALLSYIRLTIDIPPPNLLLPVGISFFTFQAISYVIDVHRNHRHVERHLGFLALYIAFFPQLVAGPIERSSHILPQLRKRLVFCRSRASSGFRLIAWGLFKKMVIADRLASIIEPVFANPTETDGVLYLFATVAFGIQIYCDFSAYSDIAIGAARSLNISLMRNFNNPFLASSLSDFWRRWHISLSTWFRDYLYLPLGGDRTTQSRWVFNILVVFLVSGLWHGAAWPFVLWGGFHGIGLIVERLSSRSRFGQYLANRFKMFRRGLTFLLVSVLWIPFRASSLADSWHMLTHLHTGWRWRFLHLFEERTLSTFLGLDALELRIVSVALCVLILVEWILPSSRFSIAAMPKWVRWAYYIIFVESILLFGVYEESNPFVYFQF